ncbi:MAG: HAD family hydrolase [Chloroflexota bacterium]|nr:HAD family hydrolase [Chloroflexota bacterium]MDE2969665.1 HAD family hydrolase [Chloroflexota bacterium]
MTTNGSHRIKAVFFDLYNTLARFWPPREEIQAQACAEFGYTVTAEGIARGYLRADAFMSRENARGQVQRRSAAEQLAFFTEYERLILEGAGVEAPPSVAGRIWERVREIPYGMALFDDVGDTLPRLRASGYVVGVITNMASTGAQVASDLGLDAWTDFVVTSGEVGIGKPHPPIYLAALARANAGPSETVMVGDSVTGDVEGSMAVGIAPVYMNRYPDVPPEEAPPEWVPTVHDLAGVEGLLRGGW